MPESTVFLAMAPGSVTPSPRMTLMTTMPKARPEHPWCCSPPENRRRREPQRDADGVTSARAVCGMQQGRHHQNSQHQQEQRRQRHHPRQNLAGAQRKEQHGGEEHAGEHRQQHRGVDILSQQRLDAPR